MSIKALEQDRTVTGYFQVTDLSSVVTCPGIGSVVMIQAESQNIRYRPDGVNPSGTEGFLLPAGETHILNIGDGNIQNIKLIEASASAVLNVISFR